MRRLFAHALLTSRGGTPCTFLTRPAVDDADDAHEADDSHDADGTGDTTRVARRR